MNEKVIDNLYNSMIFFVIAVILIVVYIKKYKIRSFDCIKRNKNGLLYISMFCLVLAGAKLYFYYNETQESKKISQQQRTTKQETSTKNQETKKQTTTKTNNEQTKKEKSTINEDNNVETILSKQTQKRNNFAIISTTKMLFSKFSHKEFLNYFEKLLNDKEIKYIILILDNNKNYYINTSSLIVEVELNKDFSIKKEVEYFIYKDGNFATDKGKIFAK